MTPEEYEAVRDLVRQVIREELNAPKVGRFDVVDQMLKRLEEYPALNTQVILTEKKGGLLPGHVEPMFGFLTDLRAALAAERSAR